MPGTDKSPPTLFSSFRDGNRGLRTRAAGVVDCEAFGK